MAYYRVHGVLSPRGETSVRRAWYLVSHSCASVFQFLVFSLSCFLIKTDILHGIKVMPQSFGVSAVIC